MDLPDVEFDCPHCGQPFSAPEQLFGTTMECSSCRGVFEVPFSAWGTIPVVGKSQSEATRFFAELQKMIILSLSDNPYLRIRDLQSSSWSPKELEEEVDPITNQRKDGSGFKRGDVTMGIAPYLIIFEMRARAIHGHLDVVDCVTGDDWKDANLLKLAIDMAEQTLGSWRSFIQEAANAMGMTFAPARQVIWVGKKEDAPDINKWWNEAAERIGRKGVASGHEMVALCDSPIWMELSEFGRPFPPFNYHSEIGWSSVFSYEAEKMGLLSKGATIQNPLKIFPINMSGGLKDGGWILEWERWNHGPSESELKRISNVQPSSTKEIKVKLPVTIDLSDMETNEREWLLKELGDLAKIKGNQLILERSKK